VATVEQLFEKAPAVLTEAFSLTMKALLMILVM